MNTFNEFGPGLMKVVMEFIYQKEATQFAKSQNLVPHKLLEIYAANNDALCLKSFIEN